MPAARPASSVTPELRNRLPVEFGGPAVPYPRDEPVADPVAGRAAAHPERVAERWSGRLAHGR